ncbi:pentapeptide repeat-containing protein [Streptomyces avermitilis]|uniref:pentapeptide repeat-containing protein n=1 Tax=Streptomyces avermitilis TaxID=33903 RepID=UPI003407D7F5
MNPGGCPGIRVRGHARCLAHLEGTERNTYLDRLTPGSDINHSGTSFTESLLDALLHALQDDTGLPRVGEAKFDGARFTGRALFDAVTFTCGAWFEGATFTGDASFLFATFAGIARFQGATFTSRALFQGATFTRGGWFDEATFTDAYFGGAKFSFARFHNATFISGARFAKATFTDDAKFYRTTFGPLSSFGLVCRQTVDVSGAVFEAPVTMEIAAREVRCVRTRWKSTATLRLRYATVDLSDAVLSSPVGVNAHFHPLTTVAGETLDESMLIPFDPSVHVTSIRGVDAAHLTLTDMDLTACLFSGAFHLDQLGLEGRCTFPSAPIGVRRRKVWPQWWTHRKTLAEEHHWRVQVAGADNPAPPRGWRTPRRSTGGTTPRPEDLAATYRQLRKTLEDSKNEPGAADFYYGEMEMRRHSRETPASERGLLLAYWLFSGYGLRASRALISLVAAITLTMLSLMWWGLPTQVPLPSATGTISDSRITLSTNKPDLAISGQLMTLPRADRAARVVMNSVIFRTSGQNLTRAGTYIELGSRICEPILLALALLAVRNRVKR